MGFKVGGNLFTNLANVAGGMAAGKRQRERENTNDARAAASDTRAEESLQLQRDEAVNMQKAREFDQSRITKHEASQQASLPALQQRLLQLNPNADKKLVAAMSYDALQSELGRLQQEKDVRLSHELNKSQQLAQLRASQQAANSQFNQSYRVWTNAMRELKSDIQFTMLATKQGLQPDSPGYTQAAAAYLRNRNNGRDLYGEYLMASRQSQQANSMLIGMGGGSTSPAMVDRQIQARMPFEALDPQAQQQVLAEVADRRAKGLPVADDLAARGVPMPAGQFSDVQSGSSSTARPSMFTPQASGPPKLNIGAAASALWDRASTPGQQLGPGGLPLPSNTAPAVPPPAASSFGAVGGSSTLPPAQQAAPVPTPLFTGVQSGASSMPAPAPAAAPAPIPSAPIAPAAPAQPLPAPPMLTAPQSTGTSLFGRQVMRMVPPSAQSVSTVTPQATASGPSLPALPAPLFSPSPRNAASIMSPPPMNPMGGGINALPNPREQQLNMLRAAMSAPQAESMARTLLDGGESYDAVTASIPELFRGLVSAKLPKRINPAPPMP